ncbi:MAG: TlpA family protein disulfide reductase [Promethearchaeota archaeon]
MEPEKLAIVGITLVVVVVGTLVGVSFLTFPTDNDNGPSQLTRTTQDTDLLELGLEVPDTWEFEMSDGTTFALSDLEGQVVLVDLMATWCTSCASQNSYLQTIVQDLTGTVVVVSLTVDSDETTSMMADYKSNKGLNWAHGVDNQQFSNYFSVSAVPTLVLIDANGFFRYFHIGVWTDASISTKVASIL